ncbi:MAG: serine hydrolase [Pseudomonadota bacterium]
MPSRYLLCATVFLLACDAQADNGAIAVANPMDSITVDGEFSDWPADLTGYPVRKNGSREDVSSSEGFEARFRVGYNSADNAVFVALTVVDDVHVTSDGQSDEDWSNLDSAIVYMDFQHTTQGSGAGLYLATGDQRDMLSDDSGWDSNAVSASWETADVAVKRVGNATHYEWRFASPHALRADTVLGIDVLIADADAKDGTSGQLYSWGPGFGKSQSGGRLGDLLLADESAALVPVSGAVALGESLTSQSVDGLRVRFQSVDRPKLWLQTITDADGRYALDMPAGQYQISNAERVLQSDDVPPQPVAAMQASLVDVKSGTPLTVATLQLEHQPLPITLPEQGALFTFKASEAKQFDQVVEALMDYYVVPGVSLALVRDGKLLYHKAYGVKSVYSGEQVSGNTLFEAASITKTVFAFAVNRMAERGEIDLDRPLYRYLPFEDIAHDERYKKITARHVLSHQSGFPNWRWQNDDGQLDIKFYPGIQFGYSGEGFEYLGRVVAHITGDSLEAVVRRETVDVMGFEQDTYFKEDPALYDLASRGHLSGLTGPFGFPGEIGVAHSMYTEARSFSNFMLSLLAQRGLTEEGYARMLEPQVAVPPEDKDNPPWPQRYGLGFHLMNSPFGRVYGHGGFNGDFSCQFELYPEHDMGFAIFTNADTGWIFVNALRDYLVLGKDASLAN